MGEEADLKRGTSVPEEAIVRSNVQRTAPPPEDQVIRMLVFLAHSISQPVQRAEAGPTERKYLEVFHQWHMHLKALDSRVTQLEAASRPQEELESEQTENKWPQYTDGDLQGLVVTLKELQDSVGDAPQMLFHVAEMETLLGRIERKAGSTNQKYEARLAASLRDICRVHSPSELSQEQVDCLKGCVTALVEGWGKMTREKLSFVRTRLLDKGLTWLPVTDKATADLQEANARD